MDLTLGFMSLFPQDLNLNGLLVIRQIDNTSPSWGVGGGGGAAGKLVPGSN